MCQTRKGPGADSCPREWILRTGGIRIRLQKIFLTGGNPDGDNPRLEAFRCLTCANLVACSLEGRLNGRFGKIQVLTPVSPESPELRVPVTVGLTDGAVELTISLNEFGRFHFLMVDRNGEIIYQASASGEELAWMMT